MIINLDDYRKKKGIPTTSLRIKLGNIKDSIDKINELMLELKQIDKKERI